MMGMGMTLLLRVAVFASLVPILFMGCHRALQLSSEASFKTIDVALPFSFSSQLDPRAILSVGDQVLAEHIFAFHSRESIKSGFSSVLSNVQFEWKKHKISITPVEPIIRSDGKRLIASDVCKSVKSSFANTRHAPFHSLLKSISCADTTITVQLQAIPANMPYLFTLPDFSIFEPDELPISASKLTPTAGPYQLIAFNTRQAMLQRNPNYPSALRANNIEYVNLHWYNTQEIDNHLMHASPEKNHLIYAYGYSATDNAINHAISKGYRVEEFPSEWLVYVGFSSAISLQDRRCIGAAVDQVRKDLVSRSLRAQTAYSIAPSDRPFGLSHSQYEKTVGSLQKTCSSTLTKSYTLGTFSTMVDLPIFRDLIAFLRNRFPDLAFKTANGVELYDGSVDIFLSPLGISPADPLGHLAFLQDTNPLVGQCIEKGDIIEAAKEPDIIGFNKRIRALETILAKQRALIPIGHFPGLVVQAPRFIRDDNLAWGWGIQTWTYHIK